ncbi:MAG TPA: PP2C family protein-serine/threonine phosphatase, partial [Rhodothermales bacterium]|nr:PP2C family protein-serine/threonine phosphatase [Rhodothermales bacterium]
MPDEPRHTESPPHPDKSKLGKTLIEDVKRGDFQRSLNRDLEDVYLYFLDPQTRHELDQKEESERWLYISFWLVKSSILKLSPARRLLLLGSVLLFVAGFFGNIFALVLGFILPLLILLLELKDKLLAQDELETGRAVQFALMPRAHPSVAGWETWLFTRPANEVGGDLVDYLEIKDGGLSLVLGDVAGKGLGAALVTATLQATLRAIAPDFDDLAALGSQVNHIFRRDGLPSRFVSMAYLEVQPDASRVRLLNAGHMPPLLIQRGGVRKMSKGGPALGLMPDAPYTEQHIDMAAGELLLVYSDGLTEARNEQGAFFEDRLRTLLPKLRGLSAEGAGRLLLAEV